MNEEKRKRAILPRVALRTYEEVGQIMGISRGRVQQIEAQAFRKMRKVLSAQNDNRVLETRKETTQCH